MRLTVLGSSASYAGPGQACAGVLVESDGARVLLDCGNGALANLSRVADPLALDAVFVSHPHPDHFLDLYALQALLRYAPDGPAPALALHLPPRLFERMGALLSERGRVELAEAFLVRELAPGVRAEVGDLAVTAVCVEHTESSFALVVEGPGGRLCYTGDTASGPAVCEAARDCDLLLAEATLPEQYAGRAPHMTAREAGELAHAADVGRLVLTHIWPTTDREAILDEAAEAFSGPVAVASELAVFEL